MSIFDVAYGKPYHVDDGMRWMNYSQLQSLGNGANSLHAHAGKSLRNDEIIVYKEEQITIKYLVELK